MSVSTLFILKNRTQTYDNYSCYSYSLNGYGLYNSASNMVRMLNDNNISSALELVVDNNGIDAVVAEHRPSHVFIEAVWVVPSKFAELIPLHPNIQWVIRIHSETPFLANEGQAVGWLFEYLNYPNITLAFNSLNIYEEFSNLVDESVKDRVVYLPNHYDGAVATSISIAPEDGVINIGCFGAVRPLKNQLIQAIAAVDFANRIGKRLKFHINATRVEQKGEPVLRNIRSLFDNFPNHQLVEHTWMEHQDFVNVIASMDISMQVSLSETFNIVTADAVVNNVPVVVSKEVNWINWLFHADPNLSRSILNKLMVIHRTEVFNSHNLNKISLNRHNKNARKLWLKFVTQ